MFIVHIHEYDYFTGNSDKEYAFETKEDAEEKYSKERNKDFDYGDHYRKTSIHESEES